jgi:hypothetical protein
VWTVGVGRALHRERSSIEYQPKVVEQRIHGSPECPDHQVDAASLKQPSPAVSLQRSPAFCISVVVARASHRHFERAQLGKLTRADARRQIHGLRPMGALFAAPCGQDSLETAPRPPLGIRLPQLLLDFDGCHSARARSLGVILGSCQFSLGIRELGQRVIESLTQLNDGCLSAGKLLAQLCYPQIARRRLSMTVADIRDLTNDVRPIDLVDHPLAGSEPVK